MRVDISCHNLNFKNFWGGEWLSYWSFDFDSNQAEGFIKVHNHYFELGNIQFNLTKKIDSAHLNKLDAKGIVEFINKHETNVRKQT